MGKWLGLFLIGFGLLLGGCAKEKVAVKPGGVVAATYSGPELFHGTVGSMTTLRGYEPLLVSGYGVVIGLEGTGSSEVPTALRQWLVNTMRKEGITGSKLGVAGLTPERLLADPSTSVVMIRGLIPAGAVKGTRFDLLVNAIDTQTTSLEGGKLLYASALSVDGLNPGMRFSRMLAKGDGYLYLDRLGTGVVSEQGMVEEKAKVDEKEKKEGEEQVKAAGGNGAGSAEQDLGLKRTAVILSGGRATEDRELYLVLNQPSASRCRMMADRINERFRHEQATEIFNTAVAKSESLIQLHIPRRFALWPGEFLGLVSRLYVQRSVGFEVAQAKRLMEELEKNNTAEMRREVGLTWEALGNTTWPVVRKGYEHGDMQIRLTALRAGARMGDDLAADYVVRLSEDESGAVRRECAEILGYLPKSLAGSHCLAKLLDDEDVDVQVAAYESLVRMDDPLLQRQVVGGQKDFRFLIDLVPSKRPLVYVSQSRLPKLVIFGENTGFVMPMLARLWGNRLMLRAEEEGKPVKVFYQGASGTEGEPAEAKMMEIAPTLANLALLLGRTPTDEDPTEGFDFSYSKVVGTVYQLHEQGWVRVPMKLQLNELVKVVEEADRLAEQGAVRPETGGGNAGKQQEKKEMQEEKPQEKEDAGEDEAKAEKKAEK